MLELSHRSPFPHRYRESEYCGREALLVQERSIARVSSSATLSEPWHQVDQFVSYTTGFVGATRHWPWNFQVQGASERAKRKRKGSRIKRRLASRPSKQLGDDVGIEIGEPLF